MDSLTHIVLGAACGDLVAGRKIGRRAMLWGAIGNSIPDFDVFAGFFTDQITGTSFHRGFTHSLLFAVLAPWVVAWLVQRFYTTGIYRRRGYKATAMTLWLLACTGIAAAINLIPVAVGGGVKLYLLLPAISLLLLFARWLWRSYWKGRQPEVQMSYRHWVWLFFLTIALHPLLDSFTSWGTQVFQPFGDLRVQWATISVVDPLATLPFMLLLIAAAGFNINDRRRRWFNIAGLAWFCGYLLVYTTWHKAAAVGVFEKSFQAKNIHYQRLYVTPTIFNNIVWTGIAEGDTAYYYGMYGFNDREAMVQRISTIPKNRQLLAEIPEDSRALKFLRWFSNGYYSVAPYHGDTLQVNDLRFGILGDSVRNNNYVFPFLLFKNEKGIWDVKPNNRDKGHVEDSKRSFGELWARIKGQ